MALATLAAGSSRAAWPDWGAVQAGQPMPAWLPLRPPSALARLQPGLDGGLLGLGRNGELWHHSSNGAWRLLGQGLDPGTPLATGHGRVVGRAADGRLWVWQSGEVQHGADSRLAPHAGALVLAQGIIAVATDSDGLQRLVRLEPHGGSWREGARSQATVLPDARPLLWNPDASAAGEPGQGHVLVFAAPSSSRYRHGVLGDAVEPTALWLLERHDLSPLLSFSLPAPHVFEDIAPRPLVWRGRRGLVTVRSGPQGGQLCLLARSQTEPHQLELAALGEPIGTRHRWLAPSTDGQRLLAVHMPHLAGVLHQYQVQGDRLLSQPLGQGVSNHQIGQRELDVSAWFGHHWLVPTHGGRHLLLVNTEHSGGQAAPRVIALPAPVLSVQPWRRGQDQGVAALLQDGSAWWLGLPV